MQFNLLNFLRSIRIAIDYMEMDLIGVPTNHCIKSAYVALRLGIILKMSDKELLDLLAYTILQDNGLTSEEIILGTKKLYSSTRCDSQALKNHCIRGDRNIKFFPLQTKRTHVLLYHHENYDGSGPFHKKAESIPIMAQIINFVASIDSEYDFCVASNEVEQRRRILEYVKLNRGVLYSPELVDCFLELYNDEDFWKDFSIKNLDERITQIAPDCKIKISYQLIGFVTKTFSKIIDNKSKFTSRHSVSLSKKIKKMAFYYRFDTTTRLKLMIAANLHDIGKLAVSNEILEKNGPLSPEEFSRIKRHPFIGHECLRHLDGFDEISEWVYNHHEKLDGSGYPRGLKAESLDFQSRLIGCLDIFQALQENRPYRKRYSKRKAYSILSSMANDGKLDQGICKDIQKVFSSCI